ncbi:family transcriptional regulator [Micractinium conductrix]|uniref:Family transcriptional regulator n=1 Tax=Micractinium conductrix TaxID=554055 RepID=A0A2P6V5S0_9CHLO|nr:family transcriptional regulator [Micractinium conductrix]|eukprot:PSC69434.1 family transcriptional regulator [Micractinium conductrix]
MGQYHKPCVELRVQDEKSGAWRKLVVQESVTLFNLHRLVQIAFVKGRLPSDGAVAALPFACTFKGKQLPQRKSFELCDSSLDAFLKGREKRSFAVTAGTRAIANTQHLVPRCIDGSDDAALDKVNKKLYETKFTGIAARDTQKKQPMKVWCSSRTSREELDDMVKSWMRAPVTAGH